MSDEILKQARIFALQYYDKTKNPYSMKVHVDLVDKFSLELAQQVDVNPLLARLAAIFHDVGKFESSKDHAQRSAVIAKEFLDSSGLFSWQQASVLEAIRSHSNRESREDEEPLNKIIQSADVLARLFEPGFESVDWKNVSPDYVHKYYKKFDAKLTLPQAREIAEPRMSVLRDCLSN